MVTAVVTFVFLAGLVAITAGAYMIEPAVGWIVGGSLAVVAAWLFRLGIDGPTRPTD